jgi:hypothetical protein
MAEFVTLRVLPAGVPLGSLSGRQRFASSTKELPVLLEFSSTKT